MNAEVYRKFLEKLSMKHFVSDIDVSEISYLHFSLIFSSWDPLLTTPCLHKPMEWLIFNSYVWKESEINLH